MRKIIAITEVCKNECYDDRTKDPVDIINDLNEQLLVLTGNTVLRTYMGMDKIMPEAFNLISERYNKKEISGVPTGFTRLDKYIDGLQPGRFVVIAGKTSTGKTSLALDMARNAAMREYPVAIFTLEMTYSELGIRLIICRFFLPQLLF
ncbi:unnamed protein product [marine sediment metagenome]|uniref:SF4 helicase domain-containing protein n=1 Tax=marine sediment metagenome TaxID=412755 RepID=X1T9V0_9ZZZZ